MRIAFIGRSEWLLSSGQAVREAGHDVPLVITGRSESHYNAREDDYKQFADECGADFHITSKLGSPEIMSAIKEAACDLAISVNWQSIVPKRVMDCFPLGVLNAHAGDLPRYRGNACLNWAILNGETKIGLCVHEMVPELDQGPVLVREYLPVDDQTYATDVHEWMVRRIPEMFVQAATGLADGSITPQPQDPDPGKALRCYPRRPADSLIDWTKPVAEVHRLIRASSRPFTGAYGQLNGEQPISVWRAEPFPPPCPYLAVPSQVCFSEQGDPVVACGDGMLRLTDVTTRDGEDAKALVLSSLRNRMA